LGTQDALDELLDALKLVGVDEKGGRFGLKEGLRGFLGFGGFAGWGGFDPREFDKHGSERTLATVPDVLIARKRDIRLAQLTKHLHDKRKSRQRVIDFLCRKFSRFQRWVTIRLGEHTGHHSCGSPLSPSNDQFGILTPNICMFSNNMHFNFWLM
jgi:hypothetical protein